MHQPDSARVILIGEISQTKPLAETLLQAGHEVLTLPSEAAVVRVNSSADLVIVADAPDHSLLDVCRRLKSSHNPASVILLSGTFRQSPCRADGLEAGADACLAFPVEARELNTHVTCLLKVRQVQMALKESEERFRLATEAMSGIVYEWSIALGSARRSAGIAEFLGWRPDEIPGHSDWWPEQIHPDDAPQVHRQFGDAVQRHAPNCCQEYRMRHKAGHYIWMWDNNRIVYDDTGKAVRVVGCAISIDERKRAEEEVRRAKEELARTNEGLELKVENRTRKLREMVAELESWSYSIAHDMRAPLRTMHSFSNFLLQEYGNRLDAVGRDYVQRIDAATHRLDDYLRDLLHYGKMGRGDLPLGTVDPRQLLNEILTTYPNLQAPRSRIEVQEPLPQVQANVSALTQVFSNLLSNAVKFVRDDRLPQVRIRAEETEGRVRLWFEDNGIGIDKQAQERLFSMFQRLHPARDYEGTGMGLAIVRRAVERMGGAVGVESEPNQGSRFWVELKSANA